MTDHFSSKNKLREYFLEVRKNLSDSLVEKNSKKIHQQILNSREFIQTNIIHTYISIQKNKEVNTIPLIKACFERGKKVVVPKIVGDGIMDHFELSSLDNLNVNKWGVPEPNDGRKFPVEDLDLVIVPMVAGDHFKNRLGYGKGFYDRFLKRCPATKIGLLFDCQLSESKLPVESYDIPLDILITETERIE